MPKIAKARAWLESRLALHGPNVRLVGRGELGARVEIVTPRRTVFFDMDTLYWDRETFDGVCIAGDVPNHADEEVPHDEEYPWPDRLLARFYMIQLDCGCAGDPTRLPVHRYYTCYRCKMAKKVRRHLKLARAAGGASQTT